VTMVLLIGLFIGLICGLAGAKKAGFVSGWVTLLNASVAIYLGIHIAPIIVGSVEVVAKFPYGAALVAMIVSILMFAILGAVASAVTGDLKITMPRLLETLGGGAIAFINGLLLWGFICLLVEISPLAESSIVKDTCRDPAEISQMWKASVGTSVSTLDVISWQSSAEDLGNIVSDLKKYAKPEKPKEAAPEPRPETSTPETGA
jgi:hypothetical protein